MDSKNLVAHHWWNKCLETTPCLNSSQICYIILQTCVSSVLCFLVNFALCTVAMYGKPAPPFWEFPTCIITSYLLTVILEVTVNWFINTSVMSLEVTWGKVAPLDSRSLSWWPAKDSSLYWYLTVSDLVIAPVVTPTATYFQRISWHERRSLPWLLFILLTVTPIFCGLTYVAYGDTTITTPSRSHRSSWPRSESSSPCSQCPSGPSSRWRASATRSRRRGSFNCL